MAKKYYRGEPDYSVAPGALLADVLEQRNMTQAELAERLGLSRKTINAIIRGDAPITAETATGLERVLGAPASFWLNAENLYRIRKAKAQENLAQYDDILKLPPIKELSARQILPKRETNEERIEDVLKFFRRRSVPELRKFWETTPCSLRHSAKLAGDPVATSTWLQIGLNKAEEAYCAPYDAAAFKSALQTIRGLTSETPELFVPKIIELCAQSGVAFVLVPQISRGAVNGAAKWLAPDKAAIIMNWRGKYGDIFWFSFFHEAAHVLLGKKRETYLDLQKATEKDAEEEAADRFARRFLIPDAFGDELRRLKTPRAVEAFAQKIGVHSGIVVGRLQNDGLIRRSHMNDLRIRYSDDALLG